MSPAQRESESEEAPTDISAERPGGGGGRCCCQGSLVWPGPFLFVFVFSFFRGNLNASDKTSGSISIPMPSSALPGISSEPPAIHGSLPGDDETARPPSPVPMLSPLAASKRPAGALSPTDVALFPTSPCTAEGCLKEARHTPGTLHPEGCPDNPLCGLSAVPEGGRTRTCRRSVQSRCHV